MSEAASSPARGEVWWCEPDPADPADPAGTTGRRRRRPVVVLSRDAAIQRLGRVLVALCTTTVRGLPSEVLLEPGEAPVPRRSVVNLDLVESVSPATLAERMGRLSDERMRAVCAALKVAVDCRD